MAEDLRDARGWPLLRDTLETIRIASLTRDPVDHGDALRLILEKAREGLELIDSIEGETHAALKGKEQEEPRA